MVRLNIIVILVALLAGCRSKQSVVEEHRDSITERVVHSVRIDTVEVAVPQQSAERWAMTDSSHLSTDIAESDAWILPDGSLRHTLRNLPARLKAPVAVSADTVVRYLTRDHTERVEVERPPSLWQRLQSSTWWLLLIATATLGVVMIFRRK